MKSCLKIFNTFTRQIAINDDEVLKDVSLRVSEHRQVHSDRKRRFKPPSEDLDANRLRGTKELDDIQKPLSDALKCGDIQTAEEMMRRTAYISASVLFIDRTYKYLRKKDKRKR